MTRFGNLHSFFGKSEHWAITPGFHSNGVLANELVGNPQAIGPGIGAQPWDGPLDQPADHRPDEHPDPEIAYSQARGANKGRSNGGGESPTKGQGKRLLGLQEALMFWRRWLKNPSQLGAILPSSPYLAKAMARAVLDQIKPGDLVLELGAGTGRFSKALLAEGLPADHLVCLELDPTLAQYLRTALPATTTIQASACVADQVIPQGLRGRFGAVMSGLPMLNFSGVMQDEILRACWQLMVPEGVFIQFTYGFSSSLRAPGHCLGKARLGRVWRNIPPACVWKYWRLDQ